MLKVHLLKIFILTICLVSIQIVSAEPVCKKDPTFNMTAFANFVEIKEGKKRFILHQTGDVSLNGA